MLEAQLVKLDLAFLVLKVLGVIFLDNHGFGVDVVVQILDVDTRFFELAEEGTKVEQRTGKLHEQTLDEDEVTRRHLSGVNVARSEGQVQSEAEVENGLLSYVESTQTSLDNHGLPRHLVKNLTIPTLLQLLVVELLDSLVVRDRLVLVELLALVDLLLFSDLGDTPLAEAVGVPCVGGEGRDHVHKVA